MAEAKQPVGELMKELSEQTSRLVRQELELARLELTRKAKHAGVGAGMFGGAGAIGIFALGALTAALVLALATAVTDWLAALIVAALYGLVAGGLALSGKSKLQEATPPVPEQAAESVKEDVQWAKSRAKQARS